MRGKSSFLILVTILCYTTPLLGTVIEHIGSYSGWDSLSWEAINGLNDGRDGVAAEVDFVGDSSNAGAYWTDNGTYVFFRVRVDVGTVDAGTFGDSHLLLIDIDDSLTPDYGFVWDSKSHNENEHGLEMQIANTIGTYWSGTKMDDIDLSAAKKLTNDINGDISGRGYDGYIRTVDGQTTDNFGDTTFIDYAVSWSYLEANTGLAKEQTWNITLGSIANATDHNNIKTDIAGGVNPSDLTTTGWVAIPEPTVISLLSLSGLAILIGRRMIPAKN